MKVTVLGRKEMEHEGMGSFLGVGRGRPRIRSSLRSSISEARTAARLGGKGLLLRLRGISIKPAQSMELMKFDMCGAAASAGCHGGDGRLGLKINVVV